MKKMRGSSFLGRILGWAGAHPVHPLDPSMEGASKVLLASYLLDFVSFG